MEWLTDNNYKCVHRVNAGNLKIHQTVQDKSAMIVCTFFGIGLIIMFTIVLMIYVIPEIDDPWGFLIGVGVIAGLMAGMPCYVTQNMTRPVVAGITVAGIVSLTAFAFVLAFYWVVPLIKEFELYLIGIIGIFGGIPAIGSAIVTGLIAIALAVSRNQRNKKRSFVTAAGGNAIANYALSQKHGSAGPFNLKNEVLNLTFQAVCGPGLGVFVDAIVVDTSVSLSGNLIGARNGFNANTGVGARNGNIEAHFLGFGGKIGADGVEVNTPSFGFNACSVM